MTIVKVLRTVASTVALVLLGVCAIFATHHGDLTVRKFFSYLAVAGGSAVYQARGTTNLHQDTLVYVGLAFMALAILLSSLPFPFSRREPSRHIDLGITKF